MNSKPIHYLTLALGLTVASPDADAAKEQAPPKKLRLEEKHGKPDTKTGTTSFRFRVNGASKEISTKGTEVGAQTTVGTGSAGGLLLANGPDRGGGEANQTGGRAGRVRVERGRERGQTERRRRSGEESGTGQLRFGEPEESGISRLTTWRARVTGQQQGVTVGGALKQKQELAQEEKQRLGPSKKFRSALIDQNRELEVLRTLSMEDLQYLLAIPSQSVVVCGGQVPQHHLIAGRIQDTNAREALRRWVGNGGDWQRAIQEAIQERA